MKHNLLEIQKSFKKNEPIKATLSVDDELSFINAGSLASEINKHMSEFDQLTINSSVAHIDLTGIQFLLSVKKTCENANKTVHFSLKLGDELKNLVIKAGFKELFD